ncbi:MAG: DUF4369 domain-containing protein [Bacteroidaceae bacterium]|nr:DUF4369 domain-containing protein [Bacteroidaceae bacterium]
MSALSLIRNLACTGAVLISASCGGNYVIEGSVGAYGYEGQRLTIEEFTPYSSTLFDSCYVSHGRFSMKGTTDMTRLVFLCRNGQPVLPMYLERGKTVISIEPTGIQRGGTRQNDLLNSFLTSKRPLDNKYDDVWQRRMELMRSGRIDTERMSELQDSLVMIVAECEELIYDFITSHFKDEVSTGVFAMLTASPSKQVSPLMKRVLDDAPDRFIESPIVQDYITRTGYKRP